MTYISLLVLGFLKSCNSFFYYFKCFLLLFDFYLSICNHLMFSDFFLLSLFFTALLFELVLVGTFWCLFCLDSYLLLLLLLFGKMPVWRYTLRYTSRSITTPDMTSLTVSGQLQISFEYCRKVRKTGMAGIEAYNSVTVLTQDHQ